MAGMALVEASSVTVKAPPLAGRRVVVGGAASAVPGIAFSVPLKLVNYIND